MSLHGHMKLGRKPARPTPHLPHMAKYLTEDTKLPPPPVDIDWGKHITDWGMLLNDQLGDCTIAGMMHLVQCMSADTGNEVEPTDAEALAAYEQLAGYNPNDPNTDQGAYLPDILTGWHSTGVSIGGNLDHVVAYVRVDPTNALHVRQAMDIFGPLYIGIDLPVTAQDQDVWDIPPGGTTSGDGQPGSWGGHCVIATAAHDSGGIFDLITWGAVKQCTGRWWDAYVDEVWAVVHKDWVGQGTTPAGFNLKQLLADMHALGNQSSAAPARLNALKNPAPHPSHR